MHGASRRQSRGGMWNDEPGISSPLTDEFSAALTHPFFPSFLISEGLSELATLQREPIHGQSDLRESDESSRIQSLEDEIASLKKQVSIQESVRHRDMAEML